MQCVSIFCGGYQCFGKWLYRKNANNGGNNIAISRRRMQCVSTFCGGYQCFGKWLYRKNTNNGGILSRFPGDACNASLHFAAAINVLVNGCTERTPTMAEYYRDFPGTHAMRLYILQRLSMF